MKQLLRLIMCALLCVLSPVGICTTLLSDRSDLLPDPSSVSLLPKNSNMFDRFTKKVQDDKLKEEALKPRSEKIPVPVKITPPKKNIQKPLPAIIPVHQSAKPATEPTSSKPSSWASRIFSTRLLLGCGAGALVAYVVDRVIFTGDYTAEIAVERKNLRDYIAQRKELRDKTEHETEYAELTELIRETRRHLAQLKALKHARTIIAPLVIVATVAVSALLPSGA